MNAPTEISLSMLFFFIAGVSSVSLVRFFQVCYMIYYRYESGLSKDVQGWYKAMKIS